MNDFTQLEICRILHLAKYPNCRDVCVCEPTGRREMPSTLRFKGVAVWSGVDRALRLVMTVELALLIQEWEKKYPNLIHKCYYQKLGGVQ
jgi:hypothetical protein